MDEGRQKSDLLQVDVDLQILPSVAAYVTGMGVKAMSSKGATERPCIAAG